MKIDFIYVIYEANLSLYIIKGILENTNYHVKVVSDKLDANTVMEMVLQVTQLPENRREYIAQRISTLTLDKYFGAKAERTVYIPNGNMNGIDTIRHLSLSPYRYILVLPYKLLPYANTPQSYKTINNSDCSDREKACYSFAYKLSKIHNNNFVLVHSELGYDGQIKDKKSLKYTKYKQYLIDSIENKVLKSYVPLNLKLPKMVTYNRITYVEEFIGNLVTSIYSNRLYKNNSCRVKYMNYNHRYPLKTKLYLHLSGVKTVTNTEYSKVIKAVPTDNLYLINKEELGSPNFHESYLLKKSILW